MKSHMRIALIPVGLAMAFLAFVNAASGIGALPFAAVGHPGWFGLNAHILSKLVDRDFGAEVANHQTQFQQGELPRFSEGLISEARDAYAVNPLDTISLRSIALGSIRQEDKTQARDLMRTAAVISKRDSVVDLWLAQDYGQLGDMNAMLASFDHALRTSVVVREAAMKPVVETLADPSSFAPLAQLLKEHPEWEDDFWLNMARDPIAVANAAEFITKTQISLEDIPQAYRDILYNNLKRNNHFDSLFRLAALDPHLTSSSVTLATGRFAAQDQNNPLGWILHSMGSATTQVLKDSDILEIDAQPGAFGIAAERIAAMSGGQELSIQLADAVPDNATLKLTANCADEAENSLAEISLRQGETGGKTSFDPEGCAYSNLELSFSVNEGRRPAIIRIAKIALKQV